jgi:type IV secretion system protein VirD4
MVWVWLSGLQHGIEPDNLLLSGLAGGAAALGIPALVAFALLPPKPLHGAARLARPGEIARARLYRADPHSILLGRHRGKLLAFNGDLHPFLAAATGKGVGFVVPNLLHRQGSVICLDIKGENYSLASGYRGRVLGQRIFRFDPLEEHGRTHGFNVLDYVRDGDLRVTDVQTVAAILVPNESHDPYWDNVARDLLVGLLLLVLEAGPALGWPVTIGQVHRLLRSEEESGEYLKALLEDLAGRGVALSGLCKRYVLSFCNEPEKPRGSIKSALATKLTLWASPLVDRATATSDFDLRRFRRAPQSPYIAIAPDDLQRLAPLVRLLVELFLSSNTKSGETPADDPGLKVPVLVLLDEFLSLGRVEKLVHALSYVRGWRIRIATVIQSEAQLQAVYGRELAEVFVDNHRARVYYRPPVHRRDLAEAISKIVGQRTVNQTSYSYGDGRSSMPTRSRTCVRTRPSSWSRGFAPSWARSSAGTWTRPSSRVAWRPCRCPPPWRWPCRMPRGSRCGPRTPRMSPPAGLSSGLRHQRPGTPLVSQQARACAPPSTRSRSPAACRLPRSWSRWPRPAPRSPTTPTPRPWPPSPRRPERVTD